MSAIPAAGDRVADYEIVRELGRGGMAVVLEVEHVVERERRAMKLMLPGARHPDAARRFRREFRALSRLEHPHVLRVFECGLHQGQPWFVAELVQGRELRMEVQAWEGLAATARFRHARRILIELARALEYIHERGLVHRDVTPSNIMVQPDGAVKLMDFGVVKEPGQDLTRVGEVVGTVAFIAPEQIDGGWVDPRADLYSLGGVFYLMLTGRRPFNARTVAGYMDKHLKAPVRPPRLLVPTIPELADEVCVRLLAKDPAERFASATHLLHVLHASGAPGPQPGTPGWMPSLVGRAGELSRLREAIALLRADEDEGDGEAGLASEQTRLPRGGLVLVEGVPGMGRSRLTAELVDLAKRHGLAVCRSRARGPDQGAFEGYRPLFEQLMQERGTPPPLALAATFGTDEAERTPGPAHGADEARVERYAVMAAMSGLLDHGKPRVIVLDELQRADRATIQLTEYLLRNRVADGREPLLFVVTRQPPAEGQPDPLATLVQGTDTGVTAARLELGPLSAAAVEELLLSVIADQPLVRVLAERLHTLGEGSPLLIGEMIRDLIEDGRILPGAEDGRGKLVMDSEAVVHGPLPVPKPVRQVLLERLAPLSAEARRVARVLAVARQELELDTLIGVTGVPEPVVVGAVDQLVAAGLVRERRVGLSERLTLYRNRVRDVLLDEIGPAERVALHRALGRRLERRYRSQAGAVVETLAWHYEHGDLPPKAVPYLMRAADRLTKRTFVDEALERLDRAVELEPRARDFLPLDTADEQLAGLRLARASALLHLGRWQEAQAQAAAADELARLLRDERLQARTATEMGCQTRREGKLTEAEGHLRRALDLAEGLGDKRLQIVPLYEYGAVQWSRGDLEAARDYFVQAMAGSEAYQDERSMALGANGLGLIALCKGQSAESRRYFEQSIEVCEKHGMVERLTIARTNLAEVHHLTGNLRKGLDLADRTVAHAREVNHRFGIALGLRCRVITLTDLGRFEEAVENGVEALRLQESLDQHEDAFVTRVHLTRALLAKGDLDAAWRSVEETVARMDEHDSEGFAPVVLAWRARLLAHRGNSAEARSALIVARKAPGRRWPHQQARVKLSLARVHEALGDREQGRARAEEALRLADSCGYRFYAMLARRLASKLIDDEVVRGRHLRVADALARSLAATLPRVDSARFLDTQGVKKRARRTLPPT